MARRATGEGEEMSHEIPRLANLGPQGLYLPPWAIGLLLAGVASAAGLGVEARIRLGAQERAIGALQVDMSRQVEGLRTELERDRERARTEAAGVAREISSIRETLAAICAATRARCP